MFCALEISLLSEVEQLPISETWLYIYPSSHADLHLAYIWSAVVVFFCVKFLFYMVIVYLQVLSL